MTEHETTATTPTPAPAPNGELSLADLDAVSGGINPQPLPPGILRDRS